MSERKVSILLSAKDNASEAFKRLGKESDILKGKLAGVGSGLGSLTSSLGAGTLGGALGGGLAFSSAIKSASDFEYALYQTTKVTRESTDEIRAKMLALPASLGSATELTQGYYQTMSAGVTDAAKAMDMLTTASKLAAVAEVTQGQAIQALSKMMAGYKGEIATVQQASDMLLDIEQLGQASVKELIPIIGDLSGVSQMAGVSAKEMAAGLALLTQTSGSPSQAATQFRALEMVLLNANETLQSVLDSLGVKNAQELIGKHGLAGTLNLIQEAAEKSDLSLAKVYGSSEAFSAASNLAANKFRTYSETLAQVGTQAGRTDESFKLFMSTFKGLEKEGTATFTNLLTLVGQEFLPGVKDCLSDLNAYMQNNAGEISKWGKSAADTLDTLGRNVKSVITLWQSLPDEITGPAGYGVVGAMLFGRTGAALGLALSLAGTVGNIVEAVEAVSAGDMSFSDFAFSNGTELDAKLKALREKKKNTEFRGKINWTPEAPATEEPATPAVPSLPSNYKPVAPKGKTGNKSSSTSVIDKTASALADLESQINRLTMTDEVFREWELTNRTLPDLMTKTGGATEKVQEFADAQRKAWADEDSAKALEKQNENLEVQTQFYAQLAEKTGNYALTNEALNRTIEKQIETWRKASIPEEYIAQWERLTRLEAARDPLSGLERGMQKYVSTATNAADQMESAFSEAFTTLGNIGGTVLTEVFENGSFAADKFFANLTRQLAIQAANAATNQLIGGIFNLLGSALSGAFTSSLGSAGRGYAGWDAAMGQYVSNVPWHHSGGIVGMGGSFSRSVPLSFFENAPRYHSGGLLPDERPIIAQTGERILSRSQTSDFDGLGAKLDRIASLLTAQSESSSSGGAGGTSVVLVDDQRKVKNYLLSAEGQKTFVAMLNSNRASVQNVAQGGRA